MRGDEPIAESKPEEIKTEEVKADKSENEIKPAEKSEEKPEE